jgi:hypothetical protein
VEFRDSDLSDEDDTEYHYSPSGNGINLIGSGPDGIFRTAAHYPSPTPACNNTIGFEHIGVYQGHDDEYYTLHVPSEMPIKEENDARTNDENQDENVNSPLGPRDRDPSSNSPLVGGSDPGVAGQASCQLTYAGMNDVKRKNNIKTNDLQQTHDFTTNELKRTNDLMNDFTTNELKRTHDLTNEFTTNELKRTHDLTNEF